MIEATFGQLIGPARAHLDAAAGLGDALDGESVAQAAGLVRRITRTLARYLADIAPYGVAESITNAQLNERIRAEVDAREALRMAAESMRAPGQPSWLSGETAPMVVQLRAAAAALAAGRDLLRTHVGTDASGLWAERSEWAAIITSQPVNRAVAGEVVSWSRQLAFLTALLSLQCAGDTVSGEAVHHGLAAASHWLLTASVILTAAQRGDPLSAMDTALLQAIPANVVPKRLPPHTGETGIELAEGVARSTVRLRSTGWATRGEAAWSPEMTTESWRWDATAAAVACHISQTMLGSLTEHPSVDVGLPGAAAQLRAAADDLRSACGRWREAAAAWDDMVTETRGTTAPGMVDFGDLVVRLGRLVFGDPQWAPNAARPAAVQAIVPGSVEFKTVFGALHHAVDAVAHVGASELRAVGTALRSGRIYVPTRTLPDCYDVPYRFAHATPDHANTVLGAYQAACRASSQALADLDGLAFTLGHPSRILPAARSAARSALGANQQSAFVRAAATVVPDVAGQLAGASAPPGAIEHAVRRLRVADPVLLVRAKAIDHAGQALLTEARRAAVTPATREVTDRREPGHSQDGPVGLSSQSFPEAASLPSASAAPGHDGRVTAAAHARQATTRWRAP